MTSERSKCDERLVVHPELVVHERAPQGGLELETADRPFAHRIVEHLDATSTQLLGGEHRDVGVAQQAGRRVADPARNRDADAGAEEHLGRVVEHERFVEHRLHAVGHRDDVVDAARAVAHDRELVATEAGELVARTQHAVDAARDHGEQLVAGLVARGCRSRS